MRGLVAGWREDDELGPLAVIVSEDARTGVYVLAEALRGSTGDHAAELDIDDQTGWVTVFAGDSASLLEPVSTSCPDIDLVAARDLACARLGSLEPWQLAPDVFAAAAIVRQDGFRTIVSYVGSEDSVLAGRLPRRRAAALAHEEAVDRRAAKYGLAGIPDAVLDHYPAIRITYQDGPAGDRPAAVRSVSYRSGMSRVGDLSASAASGVPTGVVISELNARATEALLEANAKGVRFFVDSGAFAARREGAAPVDFASVCRAYRDLADRAAHPELLSVVAPDRVGDRDGTLQLLEAYRTELLSLIDRGVELLVPLQRHVPDKPGDVAHSLADTYRETVRVLGTDRFRCALPARVSVFTESEILEFVRDAQPGRLHLLGIGSSAELPMRLRRLGALRPGLDVTTDACQFRAGLGRGRPLQQIIDADLRSASYDAVQSGHVAPETAPLLGATAVQSETVAQSPLFALAATTQELPYSGVDITEYLHDLYNTPGFLDRDDAVELASRLTEDPRERESIVLAALAVVDRDDLEAGDLSRSLEASRSRDTVSGETAEALPGGREFGSPLGYTLDRLFPDDRTVDRVVLTMLVDEATEQLRRPIRANAVAECERNREFWADWDLRVEHPFASGLGDTYRTPDGEPIRLADGSRLSWLERVAWAGRASDQSGDVALFVGADETSEAYVVAYGRVARFGSPDEAREAFVDFTSPDLGSWLERASQVRETPEVTETPASAPAPALTLVPPSSSGQKARIEDFGEVIHGARKHYAAAYRELFEFASDVPLESAPLSQSWPEPDYQRLVDEGTDPWTVAFIRALRDEVPPKPHSVWKVSSWASGVAKLRDSARAVVEKEVSRDTIEEHFLNRRVLGRVLGRVELYERAGHSRTLKGVTIEQREFSVYNGERFAQPRLMWIIEPGRLASTKAWPSRIAAAVDKEEAIAAFLVVHGKPPKAARKSSGQYDIWQYRHRPGYFIGAKIGRETVELLRFETSAEAQSYVAEHGDELGRLLDRQREVPSERRPDNEPRQGTPRRSGDVSVEQFADTFRFRGVQFGNWCEGPRRQADLNNAHDALCDLADILGITPDSLSLGGQLGLAFGARGRGGNSGVAHYEPFQVVINLTKTRGAGSLAHEWFHALDNAVARLAGRRDGFGTEIRHLSGAGVSLETAEAFHTLVRAINKTHLPSRSKKLDLRRRADYWSTGRELGARAFEAFVIERLAEYGVTNDYLANITPESSWEYMTRFSRTRQGSSYPYPTRAELATLVPAFSDFVASIDWPGRQGQANSLAAAVLRDGAQPPGATEPVLEAPAADGFGVRFVAGHGSDHPLWLVAADTADPEARARARRLGGTISTAGDETCFAFRHDGNAHAFLDATTQAAAKALEVPDPGPAMPAEPEIEQAPPSPRGPDASGTPNVSSPVVGLPTGTDVPTTPVEVSASGPAESAAVTLDSPDNRPAPHVTEIPGGYAAPEPVLGTNEHSTGPDGPDVLRVRLSLWVRDHLVERSREAGSEQERARIEETAQKVASWVSRQDTAVLAELQGLGAEQVLLRALAPDQALSRTEPQPAPRPAVQMTLGL